MVSCMNKKHNVGQGWKCRLTKQVLQSGKVGLEGLSLCRRANCRMGCSWWGSALVPAHLTTLGQSPRHREREKEGKQARQRWRA